MEAEIQNKVLQAAMRFGRTEEHGEKGATVYVHTSALPEWVEAKKRFATVDSWITHKNGMKQVIETIRNFDDWKALEWKVGKVAECVTISKNSTRKHLKTLAEPNRGISINGLRAVVVRFISRMFVWRKRRSTDTWNLLSSFRRQGIM